MQSASPSPAPCVLLTGATGFLGKVVLEELLRRRNEIGFDKVIILVREKRGQGGHERFAQNVATSPCFKNLPSNWTDHVEVVCGDLGEADCGLDAKVRAALTTRVSHIIHCAASIDFNLPVAQACTANIVSSLNMLELARACPGLVRLVSVSTAYVMPHPGGTVARSFPEALAPLPYPAAQIYQDIVEGRADQARLLRECGHPNTYTLTKCVAEHLLVERRGDVPLTIVRPSVISASWRYPFPGWIDSNAAFAGFVVTIGAGYLRVVDARGKAYLDVMPCDEVSIRIIDNTFVPADTSSPRIRYAVAGLCKNARNDRSVEGIVRFFAQNNAGKKPGIAYMGKRNLRFLAHSLHKQTMPLKVGQALFRLKGNDKMLRGARRIEDKLGMLNEIFPYFTHNTFDFRTSTPLDASFDPAEYIQIVCDGVYEHLLKHKPRQTMLGGKKHKGDVSDVRWALGRPHGNWAIRMSATVLRKVLRQGFDEVTFDQRSFERALASTNANDHVVVVPTHRSYMDFLVCSYLFFARPSLGVQIPHIAAAREFAEVPGVGWLFKQMHAFYLRRGVGKEDPELTQTVHNLVKQGKTLQFFIEGARSRSRQFLRPRRGLLRCMQATGESFVILPVSVSYDRVPEEMSFLRELKGQSKQPMRLQGLLSWTADLVRGKMHLGRLHVQCGDPLRFDKDSDPHTVSSAIMAQLQKHTVTSTYHLEAFLRAHAGLGLDLAFLRRAVEERGGTVLDSTISGDKLSVDPVLERCLRYHWMHLFLREALERHPNNAALQHYTQENGFSLKLLPKAPEGMNDERVEQLLHALFAPVCADYVALAKTAKKIGQKQVQSGAQLLRHTSFDDFTTAQGALRALVEHGLLAVHGDPDQFKLGPQAVNFAAFIDSCTWQSARLAVPERRTRAIGA